MLEMLGAVGYGGYISPVKFAVFIILFFGWLPVINWVYKDAETLGARQIYWTAIVFGAWAASAIIWLIVPVFFVGLAVYLIAAATATLMYIMQRNSLVPEFQRVLTADHIKGLFAAKAKKVQALKNFIFISSIMRSPYRSPRRPTFSATKRHTICSMTSFTAGHTTSSVPRTSKITTSFITSTALPSNSRPNPKTRWNTSLNSSKTWPTSI
jgi:hypothetical protein